jgi:trehalose-phosphatase
MSERASVLQSVAETPILLVASDYDGTLAPLVRVPSEARADPRTIEALAALSELPHTHVAVISGRARAQLRAMLAALPHAALFGSHGLEPHDGDAPALSPQQQMLLARLDAEVKGVVAAAGPGFHVERKPAAVVFHDRGVEPERAGPARQAVLNGPGALPGVHVRFGSHVIELSVASADKGAALRAIRYRAGATATLFIGDDLTDEDAFAALAPGDLGVVVGGHPTLAALRIADLDAVAELLRELLELRRAWLAQRRLTPIETHSFLSDQRTAALVDPRGRVCWLCVPRLDGPTLFGQLLGGPGAGSFEVSHGTDRAPSSQHYGGDSLVLQTVWPHMTVTDFLDCAGGRPYQRAGRTDLIRIVKGTGRARIRFAPRFDFGRIGTRLRVLDAGLEVEGCPEPVVLVAPGLTWTLHDDGRNQTAEAVADLSPGTLCLELRYGTASLRPSIASPEQRCQQTERFWSGWAASLRLPPVATELVRRSALVLKGLCYGPTGAIAAAGTTSLPEQLGGSRNWDYRFCWPRDATLAAAALLRIGNSGVAMKLCDWLLGTVDQCESPERLRPIYTVSGGHLGPEAEIGEVPGYGGSRPVRVGNAAAHQVQLDVFGPIADLVALLAEYGAAVSQDHWRLTQAMVAAVEHRWREPDHGIWEIRGPRLQHVHSKVMCWHTVNRALTLEDYLYGRQNDHWCSLRDAIRADILEHGWSERAGAFVTAYGVDALDAATLQVGLTGLVPLDDTRFVRTVERVEEHLRRGPTVYRYVCDDGLPGREGGFHLCTAWLIEAYARLGRVDDARSLFDEYVQRAGPTGLFAEQYDPDTKLALGNLPQAYSHLGLINAALAIAAAG